MSKGTKQLVLGLVAFLIVIGLLFGGDKLYRETQVTKPIISKISAIPGVDHVELQEGAQKPVLVLQFAPESDLVQLWPEIMAGLESIVGDPDRYEIRVESNSKAQKTLKAYAHLQFALQESMATGSYTIIPETIDKIGQAYGVQGEAVLSRRHLLITLKTDDEILYRVTSLPEYTIGNQANV